MTTSHQLKPEHPRRFISVEGAVNLRDFGGYTNQQGQTVREGVLFRCGTLAHIPEHAWEDFARLDVGVICDLRSQQEALESPTPTKGPFTCRVHIPIWPGSSQQFQQSVAGTGRRPGAEEFMQFMGAVTREIARDHVEAYKQLMRELVSTERGFLLHCSAGKDRTGFGAALILTLLGVDHDTVLQDYLVSNEATELFIRMRDRMLENLREQGYPAQIDEEVVRIISGVRAEYLLGAYEEIDNHYGGMHGYLEEIGITAAEEKHLLERLLI